MRDELQIDVAHCTPTHSAASSSASTRWPRRGSGGARGPARPARRVARVSGAADGRRARSPPRARWRRPIRRARPARPRRPTMRPRAEPDRVTDVAQWPEYRALRARLDELERARDREPVLPGARGRDGQPRDDRGPRACSTSRTTTTSGSRAIPTSTRAAQDAVARWGTSVSASRVVVRRAADPRGARAGDRAASSASRTRSCTSAGTRRTSRRSRTSSAPDDVILCDALMHNSAMQGARVLRRAAAHVPAQRLAARSTRCSRACAQQHRRALDRHRRRVQRGRRHPRSRALRRGEEAARRACSWWTRRTRSACSARPGAGSPSMRAWTRARSTSGWARCSKSLASCGGYIAGSAALVEYLKYTRRDSSTASGIPPANAAAALAALRKLRRRAGAGGARCASAPRYFLASLPRGGARHRRSAGTPVIPVIVGDSLRAARLSAMLLGRASTCSRWSRRRCRTTGRACGSSSRARTPRRRSTRTVTLVVERHASAGSAPDGDGARDARPAPCSTDGTGMMSGPGSAGRLRRLAARCARPRSWRAAKSWSAARPSSDGDDAWRRRSPYSIATERMRFERYENADVARRFAVGRLRLREMLAALLAIPPGEVPILIGLHGKPALARGLQRSGFRFSVAHCEELLLVALSRVGEVGIDVERVRPIERWARVADRVFGPRNGRPSGARSWAARSRRRRCFATGAAARPSSRRSEAASPG